MSIVTDVVEVVLGMRGLKADVKKILANQERQMTQADGIKEQIAGLTGQVGAIGTTTGEIATSVSNVAGDIAKLQEIIAGAGSGGLSPTETQEVADLLAGVSTALGTAVTGLQQTSADLAAVAAIVPETT